MAKSSIVPMVFVVGGIIAVPLIYNAVTTASAGDRLKLDLDGVEFVGISQGAAQLRLKLSGSNPSDTSLRLDHVMLDLGLPGSGHLARIRAGITELQGLTLRPNEVTRFGIPFSVSLASLLLTAGSQFVASLRNGQLPAEAAVTGEIKVNGFPVAFNERIPLRRAAQ